MGIIGSFGAVSSAGCCGGACVGIGVGTVSGALSGDDVVEDLSSGSDACGAVSPPGVTAGFSAGVGTGAAAGTSTGACIGASIGASDCGFASGTGPCVGRAAPRSQKMARHAPDMFRIPLVVSDFCGSTVGNGIGSDCRHSCASNLACAGAKSRLSKTHEDRFEQHCLVVGTLTRP